MSSPITLLLLHGSWHSYETWQRLTPLLEAKGYKTITPQVSFCGTAEPLTSIAPCISQIQEIIAAETSAGRNVVMVNHSFGGVVGCSAVNGFTAKNPANLTGSGKVIGIIQMCALTVPTGVSLLEFLQKGKGSDIKPIGLAGPDGWDEMKRDVVEAMYHDLTPEDGAYWASRILKHSSATRSSSENVYAGWKDVPVCFLKCTDDRASDPGTQTKMIESIKEANENVIVKDIFASHSPMLSKPEETSVLVDEAAKWFTGLTS